MKTIMVFCTIVIVKAIDKDFFYNEVEINWMIHIALFCCGIQEFIESMAKYKSLIKKS